MKRYHCKIIASFYCAAYLLIYAGFLFHRSGKPAVFQYSFEYLLFLIGLITPFFLPKIIRRIFKSIGPRRLLFIMIIDAMTLLVLYSVASAVYYNTRKLQQHRFDPYLQTPAPQVNFPIKKNPRTYRILCLGGSTTLMPAEANYPNILGRILKNRFPGLNIEIINAGQDWFTTKHSLISYVTYYRQWDPDLIIEMHGINDMCRSFSPPRFAIGGYNGQWSHFYGPALQGVLQYPAPSLEKIAYDRFRYLARELLRYWYGGFLFEMISREHIPQAKDYPIQDFVSLGMFKKYLIWTIHIARSNNAKMILVTQPVLYKEIMGSDEAHSLWFGRFFCYSQNERWQVKYPNHKSLYHAMMAFNDALEQVALSEKVGFIDAAGQIPRDLKNFTDDCHFTVAGARLLARIIAENIINSGMIEGKEK